MWPCLTFCWNMIGLAVKRWLIMFYQFFRGHVRRAVLLCYSNYAANCTYAKEMAVPAVLEILIASILREKGRF